MNKIFIFNSFTANLLYYQIRFYLHSQPKNFQMAKKKSWFSKINFSAVKDWCLSALGAIIRAGFVLYIPLIFIAGDAEKKALGRLITDAWESGRYQQQLPPGM